MAYYLGLTERKKSFRRPPFSSLPHHASPHPHHWFALLVCVSASVDSECHFNNFPCFRAFSVPRLLASPLAVLFLSRVSPCLSPLLLCVRSCKLDFTSNVIGLDNFRNTTYHSKPAIVRVISVNNNTIGALA